MISVSGGEAGVLRHHATSSHLCVTRLTLDFVVRGPVVRGPAVLGPAMRGLLVIRATHL
nr:hypothetical protein GCM10020241_17560 [Streptoalloteichus tenebrarius]